MMLNQRNPSTYRLTSSPSRPRVVTASFRRHRFPYFSSFTHSLAVLDSDNAINSRASADSTTIARTTVQLRTLTGRKVCNVEIRRRQSTTGQLYHCNSLSGDKRHEANQQTNHTADPASRQPARSHAINPTVSHCTHRLLSTPRTNRVCETSSERAAGRGRAGTEQRR